MQAACAIASALGRQPRAAALALALPLGGGMLASTAVVNDIDSWYRHILKPSWTPPDWLFGPVWTALYVMMGAASFLVWREGGWETQAWPLSLYGVQLALNLAWTPLFFKAHALTLASVDICSLWLALLATLVEFRCVLGAPLAAGLLGPCLAWVSYAAALTLWIAAHNPGHSSVLATGGKRITGTRDGKGQQAQGTGEEDQAGKAKDT